MKIYKNITDAIVRITKVLLMLLIGGLAGLILFELLIRNLFDKSFRASIEVCGIMFMWMAFLGIIYLYDKSGLMRFEILLTRVKEPIFSILWYINKLISLMLGIVMAVSYINLYPFISTRYFSTIQFLPYSFQFLPMALAGGFMALKTVYQLIEKTAALLKHEEKGR